MPSDDPTSRASPGSPVAAVTRVLADDPLMRKHQEKGKKRAKPWELSDPESDGAHERKKRRVGEKQVRYAYVAEKFPTQCKAPTKEKSVAYYESATDGKVPTRRHQEWQPHRARPSPLDLTDLEYVRELGAGSYGSVGVVRVRKRQHQHPDDVQNAELAIKSILKRRIREREPRHPDFFQDRADDEKNFERGNLFQLPWHPFIAGMYDCLADSRNLYMLQELGSLGTLDAYMEKHAPLPASVAQFYFANIAVALEFLASQKFVHGDLKPSNILIGANGYLLLADFGLASRWDEERDWGLVGTQNYMSPEVTRGAISPAATQALDWWSAACILFEMATGHMVFELPEDDPERFPDYDAADEDVHLRILAAHYVWPRDVRVDPLLKQFVDEMLVWDTQKRLGTACKRLDCETEKVVNVGVRCHAWFDGYPWADIENRTYAPPYLPLHPLPATETWHSRRMPAQAQMPGLPQVLPPKHLQWDTRLRNWVRADEEGDRQGAAAARAAQQARVVQEVEDYRKERDALLQCVKDHRKKCDAVQHTTEEAAPAKASTTEVTEDADTEDLEVVPVSSIPRTLIAGTLPLFRPPTVKPKVFPPRTPSPTPSPLPPASLPGAVPTIEVTTAELLHYGAAQGWKVAELAQRIACWKREADGRGGAPTRTEVNWEAKRLRVLLQRRTTKLEGRMQPILAGACHLPAHAMQGVLAMRAAAEAEERRLETVLDDALRYAAAQRWTLRQCAVMAVDKTGLSKAEYKERVDRFEGHLHRHVEKRAREAPQAAQGLPQVSVPAGPSDLAGWWSAQDDSNVAGPSKVAPAQAQPPRQLANGTSNGSRAASTPAAQPVAGPSTSAPVKAPAVPQTASGSSGPSLAPRPTAGPSRIVKGPVPQSMLGSSKVVELRKAPVSQPAAGPSNVASRSVQQAAVPRQAAKGPAEAKVPQLVPQRKAGPAQNLKQERSRATETQQRTVEQGPPTLVRKATRYEPYPTQRPQGMPMQPEGAAKLPATGRPRVHGPNGHAVSQPDKRAVAANGGAAHRAGPAKGAQAKAGKPAQNTSSASPGLAASQPQPGHLPRTPPAQIFKLSNPPKVTPPSGAGAVPQAGPRTRPRVRAPTGAERGGQHDDALERIWSQRSPEPTSMRARASRPPGAGAVGPRVRARSPTRAERAQAPAAGASSRADGKRRTGPAQSAPPLNPFVLPDGESSDEEEDTPTKPRVPSAGPVAASASRLRAPIWSPPLSPAGAAAGSPSGSVMGSPPRWSP
ncbi:kinase-like domain-containing protein [Phanerochaete sordida]|uniref:cAMP-dependent protein kinase n=1 Tax=Phanerochaete sordida TaxID=48140 RepID=A0A9P3G2T9_9APHY|nr:kinase-like domain-containing protein [Phanerochaete sordida]